MTRNDDPAPDGVDRSTPKTFGILNVVFALALMGCGICQNFYALLPSLMNFTTEMQANRDAQFEAKKAAEIAKLREQEADAPEGEAREAITARREALEAVGPPGPPRGPMLSAPGLRDARLLGHFLGDLLTNLILNVLMLIAGVGLIFFKPWGRSLAVFVAWAKIARLVLLAISVTIVVAPIAAKALAEVERQAAAEEPKAVAPPGGRPASSWIGAVISGYAWGVALTGVIYPALTIWMLNRAPVRRAFRPADPGP